MRVLHVAGGIPSDGAGRGMLWLHRALRAGGVDSHVLFQRAEPGDAEVDALTGSFARKVRQSVLSNLDELPLKAYPQRSGLFSCAFAGNDITRLPGYAEADIVHLHWINQGMLSLSGIARIEKPSVWTVRDMWPFTGGCHYALGCERYTGRCGRCPVLGSRREHDLSTLVQWRKRRAFASRAPHLVAISEWIAEGIRASRVFGEAVPVSTIANGVDVQAYHPIDKREARKLLGIEPDRRVVLCGAQSLGSAYKGLPVYLDATGRVDHECLYVFFGRPDPRVAERLGARCLQLGFLHDTVSLRLAYSAADVFVAPSLQEAFGKTLIEALACGTPVVCFDATGPRDIVEHRVTGYRAMPGNALDLARGIDEILSQAPKDFAALCERARDDACARFAIEHIAARYIDEVYRPVLDGSRGR